jgi:raffinose/stachyose/melibiose transport system substrate-binding protein
MRTSLLRRLWLVAIAVVILTITACGGNSNVNNAANTNKESDNVKAETPKDTSDEKVTLRLYQYQGIPTDKLTYDYAIAEMKKLMPNVEVEFEARTDGDGTKLRTYAATGNLPDIFESTPSEIEAFKTSNNILALDEYVDELKYADSILPTVASNLYNNDGHIYAVAKDGQRVALMYYNKKVFADNGVAVPTNYDEFLAAVKAFSAKDIVPVAFFQKDKWPSVQFFDAISTRLDPDGLKKVDQGNAKITDEPYRYAAEKMYELAQAGLAGKGAFTREYNEAYAMFVAGEAAMLQNGSWALGDLSKDMGDNVDYMLNPYADTATMENTKYAMAGGDTEGGYSVSASTKHPEIAAKWAIQYSLAYAKGAVLKAGFVNSLLKENVQPEVPFTAMQLRFVSELPQIQSVSGFPWTETNINFKTALEDNTSNLLTGDYTPDQFIADMEKALNK